MTSTRLRECLEHLGWSQRYLAELLAIHQTTVQRMAMGKHAVPANLAQWLELRARHAAIHPLPIGWQRGERGEDAA